MNDTLLKTGDVWDCYGEKRSISDTSIFIWKTKNWKHAFYMASCLSLEYNLKSVLIKITELSGKKIYNLIASDLTKENSPDEIISNLKSDGFFNSKITYKNSTTVKQHDDR